MCFVHVPKTGGTSIEQAFGLRHDHRVAVCNHSISIIRDPIDRLSSAYNFCKKAPWDAVLKRRQWNNSHCCHSSTLVKDFSQWLMQILGGQDCRMPGAGFPHSFVASTKYWLSGSVHTTYLRTNCSGFRDSPHPPPKKTEFEERERTTLWLLETTYATTSDRTQ